MDGRNRLKILHIDPEMGWGGGEAEVIGLLRYLALWGHHNDVLCHPEGRLLNEARKLSIPTFPIRIRNEIDFTPVWSLRRRIRHEKYDIIHFHTKRAHALSSWPLGVDSRSKCVVTRRMDYRLKRNWYNDWLYNRRVDGIVAISQRIADVLIRGGAKREKIRIIYSGVDPALFQPTAPVGERPGPLVIGTAAVLEERKGYAFLLEAAALLKSQGHRLAYRFAGEGSQRERLEKLVMKLGLKEEVFFAGFVSDVPAFLSTIDIFALPSVNEGLGVAVLEAMAAGRPVVASRVGGIPELVEDRITGVLVPPEDPQALAEAISQLASEKPLAQEMGAKGCKRVHERFTLEKMARRNEKYYYELLYGPDSSDRVEDERG